MITFQKFVLRGNKEKYRDVMKEIDKEPFEIAIKELIAVVHVMTLGIESGIDDRDYAAACMSVIECRLRQILNGLEHGKLES